MLNLEEKCHNMQVGIDRFMEKCQILRDKGFSTPIFIHDKLMTQLGDVDRLKKLSKEQASILGIKAFPIRKVLYDTLENIFFLDHEVKYLFVSKPNFSKYTEVDEIYRRMLKVKLPEDEWWEKMTNLL